MSKRNQNMTLPEMFNHLFKVISSERFLHKQGLGNEVPFFICPYSPTDAIEMEGLRAQLSTKLANQGIQVLEINIYDLSIEILQERGIWNTILSRESSLSKEKLQELLQNTLDPEQNLIPAIAKRMQESEFDVMFLSGAGEVFPYIRSHNVLNNLQSTAKQQPTILFFPGAYTDSDTRGTSLDLFGKVQDENHYRDRYYRAFNIFHYEI